MSSAQGSKPDGPGPQGMVLFISPAGAQTKSPAPGDGSYLSTRRGCKAQRPRGVELGAPAEVVFIHPAGALSPGQNDGPPDRGSPC